jgi:hypothetical protein
MDWSAAELLSTFWWVDADHAGDQPIPGLRIAGGQAHGVGLSDDIGLQNPPDRIRLLVLVPTWADSVPLSPQDEMAVEGELKRACFGADIDRVRVIATNSGLAVDGSELGRVGWHNLLISPEESDRVGGQTRIPSSRTADQLAPLVAANVATLGGLWQGIDDAPLDGEQSPSNGEVALTRTHVRRLDGSLLEAELRERALSLGEEIPLPGPSDKFGRLRDAGTATDDFARVLLTRHRTLFTTPRQQPEKERQSKIGIWAIIKLFFAFLAEQFDPGAWLRQVGAYLGNVARSKVQNSLLGDKASSRFEVSLDVRGIDAAAEEAEELGRRLDSGGVRSHEAAGDFSPLWPEFVEAACTLIDGEDRLDDPDDPAISLAAVRVDGTKVGVLPRVDQCAPTARFRVDRKYGLPPYLWDVPAYDVEVLAELESRLNGLDAAQRNDILAANGVSTLAEWRARYEHSYTFQVGKRISDRIVELRSELAMLLAEVLPSADPAVDKKGRLRRILLAVFGVLLVAGIVAGLWVGSTLADPLGLLPWFLAAAAICVLVIVPFVALLWAVGAVIGFARAHRDLFRELNRRRERVSSQKAREFNLAAAQRALVKAVEGYRQFRYWAQVLTVFLNDPYGSESGKAAAHALRLVGLPRNAKLVGLSVPDDAKTSAVAKLQSKHFTKGWLSPAWDAVLGDVGNRLGPAEIELKDTPRMIFQADSAPDGRLARWAAILREQGCGTVAGDQARPQLARLLKESTDLGLRSGTVLDTSGNPITGPQGKPLTVEEFFAQVRSGSPAPFDDRVLLPGNDRAQAVFSTWPRAHQDGLSEIDVRADLGEAVPPFSFCIPEGDPQVEPAPKQSKRQGFM